MGFSGFRLVSPKSYFRNKSFRLCSALFVFCATLAIPVVGPFVDEPLADQAAAPDGQDLRRTSPVPPADLVIVDMTRRNAIFGMYRMSQMTEPAWDLLGRTIDWAIDYKDHAVTKIWLATYNGTLDPDTDEDGLAAYNYLINTMGFDPDNVDVHHQSTIETGNFTGYDLVFYPWYAEWSCRDPANVMIQNVPYVTAETCGGQQMGIATGHTTMLRRRDYAFVVDNAHDITSTYPLGQFNLSQGMWMNATEAAGTGRVLVNANGSDFPLVAYEIGCDGLESGGTGTTTCGTRQYTYPVTDVDGKLKDVYIATDDPYLSSYSNVCLPSGWSYTIVDNWFGNHEPSKTTHGSTSAFTDNRGQWLIHFSDDTPGGGLSGTGLPSAFTFGFDHARPSHDVGWRAVGGTGAGMTDWSLPFSSGGGPVHGPTFPLVYCQGTECGGDGDTQYQYRIEDHSETLTDFYVATDDPQETNYANVHLPTGWSFSVEADTYPINHEPGRTNHESIATFNGNAGRWAIHFSGPPVAGGVVIVGFDHSAPSHDVGWRVVDLGGASTVTEDWSFPVGRGVGPLHGPAVPVVICDGTASGGGGSREYEYLVEDHSLSLTDLYIATDGANPVLYQNRLMPADWTLTVESDAFPIDHDVDESPHGSVSEQRGENFVLNVLHFRDYSPGEGLPDGKARFGFDFALLGWQPHDVGWRAVDSGGSRITAGNWQFPVGLGVGPVHTPKESPSVGCDGTESTGTGSVSCDGIPRRYSYPVVDPHGEVSDVYIGTADPHLVDYSNFCMPAGWSFAIESNSFGVGKGVHKSAHGSPASVRVSTAAHLVHFSGPAGLPGGSFTFGFDNPRGSIDYGWHVAGMALDYDEIWSNKPVGAGEGPVHGPDERPWGIPVATNFGLVAIILLLLTAGATVLYTQRRLG
jgi:hypothetical protein